MLSLSALTFVKLAVISLGLFNLVITTRRSPTPSAAEPHRFYLKEQNLELLQLQVPDIGTRTLFTEGTTHYSVNGTQADLEWASLIPEGNGGLVLIGPDARPYAVSMFHSLHCLDRIRKAIVQKPESAQSWYHVEHCFNYVRQMILCAANTRLNPIDRASSTGEPAIDGIGLEYTCRDWYKVYEAFQANYALNRSMLFGNQI